MNTTELINYLSMNTGALTLQDIFLNFIVATIMGLTIFLSYRISHSGASYSARFNVSLVMLLLVTTLVMNVIGNNIALSLGMVGALSIVRFRTAIKDPRDTTYIFWCIAVGVCCGVSEYMIAGVGTSVIFLLMLVFGFVRKNERYLIVIRGSKESSESIKKGMDNLFHKKAVLRVNNNTNSTTEYIYEVAERHLLAVDQKASVSKYFLDMKGVTAANIVCQNDEVNR
ncbi:MAG: DUF4956 domain-containing protein [Eubacteriales bacterium]